MQISSLSREYVKVRIRAKESGAAVDPSGDTVQFAFTDVGVEPVTADWTAGSWETDSTSTPVRYFARAEVGPSTTVGALTDGTYDVWVKVTDSPETPVRMVGKLVVT